MVSLDTVEQMVKVASADTRASLVDLDIQDIVELEHPVSADIQVIQQVVSPDIVVHRGSVDIHLPRGSVVILVLEHLVFLVIPDLKAHRVFQVTLLPLLAQAASQDIVVQV